MIAYFDSSALVPLLVRETRSSDSQEVWESASRVACVRIAYTEVCAALAMARRIERIDEPTRFDLVRRFDSLWNQIDIVEVNESLAMRAADLARAFALRGYDAIHLAAAEIVADKATIFASWDNDLAAAANKLGLNSTS